MALALLGEQRVKDLSTPSKEGRLCSIHYMPARREVLQRHRWRDARKRARLAQIAESPAFGWDYQYQLPVDLVRLVEVRTGADYDIQAPQREFLIEGTKLLSNNPTAGVLYIFDAPTAELRPLLVNAVATLLAAKMALSLTGDSRLQGALYQKAEDDIAEAWLRDAREHSSAENSLILRDARTSIGLVNTRGADVFGVGDEFPLSEINATPEIIGAGIPDQSGEAGEPI